MSSSNRRKGHRAGDSIDPRVPGLTPWLVPSLAALAGYLLAMRVRRAALADDRLLPLAWLAHGLHAGVLTSSASAARPGRALRLRASALAATAWLVIGLHALESRFVPVPGCGAGWRCPADDAGAGDAVSPARVCLQLALAPLHWMMGLASLRSGGAAVLHAAWLDRAERQMRDRPRPARGTGRRSACRC